MPASDAAPPYGSLTGSMVFLWFVFRGIGTVILVPLVEEMFFRLYLESALRGSAPDRPAPPWRSVLAALGTAALHDRWAEAFAAGLILSWVVRRTGRITAGILAHATANLIVFGAAILTSNLHII